MADEFIDQRITMVRITNNGDATFNDRYDGVPYIVSKGQTLSIPLDVAAHIFGYHPGVDPTAMFRHVCKRQGWNTPKHIEEDEDGRTLAERLFANLRIDPVIYKMVEEKPDPKKPIPADPAIEDERPRRTNRLLSEADSPVLR